MELNRTLLQRLRSCAEAALAWVSYQLAQVPPQALRYRPKQHRKRVPTRPVTRVLRRLQKQPHPRTSRSGHGRRKKHITKPHESGSSATYRWRRRAIQQEKHQGACHAPALRAARGRRTGQRAPKDDSFEARSQFVAGYGGMTYSAAPTQYQPTFGNAPYSIPYASSPGLMPGMGYSTTPTQSLPAYEPQAPFNGPQNFPMGFPPQYGSNDSWPSAQSPQLGSYYNYGPTPGQSAPMYPQHSMQSPLMNQYPQPVHSSFPQMNQGWTTPQYQGLQQSPMMQNAQGVPWPNLQGQLNAGSTPSYAYGQLPPQTYGNTYSTPNQHPLPGSFNRSIFNPQTRSFIPANSAGRYSGKSGKSNQPKVSGRSGGNGETAKSGESAHAATGQSTVLPQSAGNGVTSSKVAVESIQKKWGTPAHLPKKPPPSQVPPAFAVEGKPALPPQLPYPAVPSSMGVASPMVVTGGVGGYSGGINGGLAAGS